MESALWTDVKVEGEGGGKQSSEAFAQVNSWVKVDGAEVPITTDANGDDTHDDLSYGDVVVNNRYFEVETHFLDDLEEELGSVTDAYLQMWNHTRSTNGFNRVALNLGASDYYPASKNHTVELEADLDVSVDDDKAHAKAVVGPRTLVGVPAKFANDATV